MSYKCPVCGEPDANAYLRCYHPACPDGRDQARLNVHAEHHSDCRCRTCRPELWHKPFNPRRAIFKAIIWALAIAGMVTIIWAAMDEASIHKPRRVLTDPNGNPIMRLDPNPKTCFEYWPIKFCA